MSEPASISAEEYRYRQLSTLTEKQFQQAVIQEARACGWRVFHPYHMQRSAYGYPDLTLVHREHGVLFLELKRETDGRVTDHQRAWIEDLRAAGARARIVRPCDHRWITAVLQGEGMEVER